MTATTFPTGELIEAFPIRLQSGATYHATLHRTERRSGRRVVVRESPAGRVLFDTDDCYDLANCTAKLDAWLLTL